MTHLSSDDGQRTFPRGSSLLARSGNHQVIRRSERAGALLGDEEFAAGSPGASHRTGGSTWRWVLTGMWFEKHWPTLQELAQEIRVDA